MNLLMVQYTFSSLVLHFMLYSIEEKLLVRASLKTTDSRLFVKLDLWL